MSGFADIFESIFSGFGGMGGQAAARRRRGRRPPRVRVVPAPNQRRHDPPHAHVVLQGVERAIAGATPDPVGVAEEPRRADEGG